MTVSPQRLTAASGLCAAAAGALFIGVQIKHPHLDATSIQTTEMVVRDTLKVVMAALALVGFTGMYLSQVRRNGLLGLIGYVVLSAGYLMILSTAFVAAFVLPHIAEANPIYVNDLLDVTSGRVSSADIGAMQVVNQVQGVAYLAGGVLFGVALFRARVLARWATALLAVGGLVTVALAMMPDAFYRLLAFPNAIAMIGLGVSLCRTSRAAFSVEDSVASGGSHAEVAAAR